LSASARYKNLAILHQFFVGKSTRADRLRFYRAYSREWRRLTEGVHGESPSNPRLCNADRSEIICLEEMLATGALRGWNLADRAWRRGNRHVRKLRLSWGEARGLATLVPDWLREVCNDPEQLFQTGLVRWYKRTARCRVGEVALGTAPAPGLTHAVLKCV